MKASLDTKKANLVKARFIKEFKMSVQEVNLAKQCKIKLKTAEQLLGEIK